MPTFVLVLAAALVAPGNGPQMVSGAMEQGLDLRGTWEGVWLLPDGEIRWCRWGEGELHLSDGGIIEALPFTAADEGGGGLLLRVRGMPCYGICQHREDKLIICLTPPGGDRPTSFRAGNGQDLFILHRVKPGK